MLLDEEPAALIRSTTLNFNTAPDQSSIQRIRSSLSTLSESRSLRLSHHTSTLKRAQRHLSTLHAQHHLTVQSHDPAEHAAHILALDTQKFKIAKEASDLEIETERLEGELGRTENTLREMSERGLTGREGDDAGERQGEEMQVLKLKLYQSLGVDVQGDAGKGGGWTKAIVRNDRSGTAKVIEMGRATSTGRIWEAM